MKRRELITLIGGAVVTWPTVAFGQQSDKPTIGYFSTRSSEAEEPFKVAFHRGLKAAGFVEGRNLSIEYRYANGQDDRLPAIAADLVRQQVAVLVATDGPSASAAKKASATIPIVFSAGGGPIRLGLVASLNRPDGNATGVFVFVAELGPKRLQLLRDTVADAKLIAYVVNLSSGSGPAQAKAMQAAAEAMGQRLLVLNADTEKQVNKSFSTIADSKADAIVYSASPFFQVVRDQLVTLAARHSIPAIYEWPEFVRSGGLMSYSSSPSEIGMQIGSYTGQILKGEKTSTLPVVQSSKFELTINLKTAKALGLTIPPGILAISDEVIE
jgi:putative tryptophan/tyrosine transport system substrate-binding protein